MFPNFLHLSHHMQSHLSTLNFLCAVKDAASTWENNLSPLDLKMKVFLSLDALGDKSLSFQAASTE
jgi:hypothetical protein